MVKFISEEALLELKNNKSVLFKDVISRGKKVQEVFHNDNLVRETNIPADDFELYMSAEKPETTDVENIKRVYKYMSALSESQASDERIWTAYTLSIFADYMRYRWPAESETAMMNHYFFSYSPKRSLFRNGVARLWWIGHLTYDASREDNKFALTEYVCSKQDHINFLLDINFGNNPSIVRAVIKALMDAEEEGIDVDRDVVRKASEYINILGGTYLIDAMPFETVYDKTKDLIRKIDMERKLAKVV